MKNIKSMSKCDSESDVDSLTTCGSSEHRMSSNVTSEYNLDAMTDVHFNVDSSPLNLLVPDSDHRLAEPTVRLSELQKACFESASLKEQAEVSRQRSELELAHMKILHGQLEFAYRNQKVTFGRLDADYRKLKEVHENTCHEMERLRNEKDDNERNYSQTIETFTSKYASLEDEYKRTDQKLNTAVNENDALQREIANLRSMFETTDKNRLSCKLEEQSSGNSDIQKAFEKLSQQYQTSLIEHEATRAKLVRLQTDVPVILQTALTDAVERVRMVAKVQLEAVNQRLQSTEDRLQSHLRRSRELAEVQPIPTDELKQSKSESGYNHEWLRGKLVWILEHAVKTKGNLTNGLDEQSSEIPQAVPRRTVNMDRSCSPILPSTIDSAQTISACSTWFEIEHLVMKIVDNMKTYPNVREDIRSGDIETSTVQTARKLQKTNQDLRVRILGLQSKLKALRTESTAASALPECKCRRKQQKSTNRPPNSVDAPEACHSTIVEELQVRCFRALSEAGRWRRRWKDKEQALKLERERSTAVQLTSAANQRLKKRFLQSICQLVKDTARQIDRIVDNHILKMSTHHIQVSPLLSTAIHKPSCRVQNEASHQPPTPRRRSATITASTSPSYLNKPDGDGIFPTRSTLCECDNSGHREISTYTKTFPPSSYTEHLVYDENVHTNCNNNVGISTESEQFVNLSSNPEIDETSSDDDKSMITLREEPQQSDPGKTFQCKSKISHTVSEEEYLSVDTALTYLSGTTVDTNEEVVLDKHEQQPVPVDSLQLRSVGRSTIDPQWMELRKSVRNELNRVMMDVKRQVQQLSELHMEIIALPADASDLVADGSLLPCSEQPAVQNSRWVDVTGNGEQRIETGCISHFVPTANFTTRHQRYETMSTQQATLRPAKRPSSHHSKKSSANGSADLVKPMSNGPVAMSKRTKKLISDKVFRKPVEAALRSQTNVPPNDRHSKPTVNKTFATMRSSVRAMSAIPIPNRTMTENSSIAGNTTVRCFPQIILSCHSNTHSKRGHTATPRELPTINDMLHVHKIAKSGEDKNPQSTHQFGLPPIINQTPPCAPKPKPIENNLSPTKSIFPTSTINPHRIGSISNHESSGIDRPGSLLSIGRIIVQHCNRWVIGTESREPPSAVARNGTISVC